MLRFMKKLFKLETLLLYGGSYSYYENSLDKFLIWTLCLTVLTGPSSGPQTTMRPAHHLCFGIVGIIILWTLFSPIGPSGDGKNFFVPVRVGKMVEKSNGVKTVSSQMVTFVRAGLG